MFNFSNFVPNINADKLLENPKHLPCNCSGLQYVDKDHDHIVTGDFRIISDNKCVKSFVCAQNLGKVSAIILK